MFTTSNGILGLAMSLPKENPNTKPLKSPINFLPFAGLLLDTLTKIGHSFTYRGRPCWKGITL
jgi:hypothetical protein